ncbi:MAG: hypothetical protein HQM16_12295 [Deltaproteobacteria bacterium]|nr:hypothetical protein [Deltaproteobacteria bacterium]
MKECTFCEYRGYSPEVCRLHMRHCAVLTRGAKEQPEHRSKKPGMRVLVGVGAGVLAATVGIGAASLVSAHALAYALAAKVSAGLGGGIFGYADDCAPRAQRRIA